MPQDISRMVDSAADYINHWTKTELTRIQRSAPICVPVKNGYKIGAYKLIVGKNNQCAVYDQFNELKHTFENKRSAVLYVIYNLKRQYKTADNILKLDIEINKNYTDIQAWRNCMRSAKIKKDFDTMDIRQSRLDLAEKQLELAQSDLSKIYLMAKYNKIWDL